MSAIWTSAAILAALVLAALTGLGWLAYAAIREAGYRDIETHPERYGA